MTQSPTDAVLGAISFDAHGLVPAIAQQHDTGEVLMLAWMNREAVAETLATGRVCYFSRSRNGSVAQGRDLRPGAAPARAARRLRRRHAAAAGGPARRRLPHRSALRASSARCATARWWRSPRRWSRRRRSTAPATGMAESPRHPADRPRRRGQVHPAAALARPRRTPQALPTPRASRWWTAQPDPPMWWNAGCPCCAPRDDVARALRALLPRVRREEVRRAVIETTGLADPGPSWPRC